MDSAPSTVAQLKDALKAKGIAFPSKARKADLMKLLTDASATPPPPPPPVLPRTIADLRAALIEKNIKIPAGAKKSDLVALWEDAAGEDEQLPACAFCGEEFVGRVRQAKCPYDGAVAETHHAVCVECVQKQALQSVNRPRCEYCKRDYSTKALFEMLGPSFVTGALQKHLKELDVQAQIALLPEVAEEAAQIKIAERARADYEVLCKQLDSSRELQMARAERSAAETELIRELRKDYPVLFRAMEEAKATRDEAVAEARGHGYGDAAVKKAHHLMAKAREASRALANQLKEDAKKQGVKAGKTPYQIWKSDNKARLESVEFLQRWLGMPVHHFRGELYADLVRIGYYTEKNVVKIGMKREWEDFKKSDGYQACLEAGRSGHIEPTKFSEIRKRIALADQKVTRIETTNRALKQEAALALPAARFAHGPAGEKLAKPSRHFVFPCCAGECNGLVERESITTEGGARRTKFTCIVCSTEYCSRCNQVKAKEHKCKQEDVDTAVELAKNTKPCPKCAVGIFKIDGCAMMWCTNCHTAFDWRSLEIVVSGTIHNPHYHEYLRNRGTVLRPGGDVVCGGLPAVIHPNRDDPEFQTLNAIFRRAGEIVEFITGYRERTADGELRELRIQYLSGSGPYTGLTKDAARQKFCNAILRIKNKYERRTAAYQIFHALSAVLIERFRALNGESGREVPSVAAQKAVVNELKEAFRIFNEAFRTEWKYLGGAAPNIQINLPIAFWMFH